MHIIVKKVIDRLRNPPNIQYNYTQRDFYVCSRGRPLKDSLHNCLRNPKSEESNDFNPLGAGG